MAQNAAARDSMPAGFDSEVTLFSGWQQYWDPLAEQRLRLSIVSLSDELAELTPLLIERFGRDAGRNRIQTFR